MAVKLLLSHIRALPFDFHAEVEAFIEAQRQHRFTVDVAAPVARHEWVEQAVKRVRGADGEPDDFLADYEIEDDTPPPPALNQKKQRLVAQLHAAVNEKHDALMPPLKTRLWNHDFHRISVLISAVRSEPDEKPEAHHARALTTLTPKDSGFHAEHSARLKRLEELQYYLAECESEIHDLTEETVDGWQPKAMPL